MSDRVTPYEKTTWVNSPSRTSPIDASNLNHIEQGVKAVTDAVNDLPDIPQVEPATRNSLGVVKVGTNLSITNDGTLSADAQQYTLPPATRNELGGVIVGNNLNVDQNGVISAPSLQPATTGQLGGIKVGNHLTIEEDGTLNADDQGGSYVLPPATSNSLGGIIVGDNLSIDLNGRLSSLGGGGSGYFELEGTDLIYYSSGGGGGGGSTTFNGKLPDILKEFREDPMLTVIDDTKIVYVGTIATGLSFTVNADGSFTVNGSSATSPIVMDLSDYNDIWEFATLEDLEECFFAVASIGSGIRAEAFKTTYEISGPSTIVSHDVVTAVDTGLVTRDSKLVSNDATNPSIDIANLCIYFQSNVEYNHVRVYPRYLVSTNKNPQLYYNNILFEKIKNIIPEREVDYPLYLSNATITCYLLNSGYFGITQFNDPPGGTAYFDLDVLFPEIVSELDNEIPASAYFYAGFDEPVKGVYLALVDQNGDAIVSDNGVYNLENNRTGDETGEFSHIRLYITSAVHDDISHLKINPQFIKYIYEHSTQEIPIATPSQLGVIKIGENLSIEEDGTLNADAHPVGIATTSSLGTVKIGSRLSIASDGTLSADNQSYTLPNATTSSKGGVIIGDDIAVDNSAKISADLFRLLTPVMKANNAPSGEAIASSEYSTSYKAYFAFTQATTSGNGWRASDNTVVGSWIGYHFETPVCVTRVIIYNASVSAPKRFKIQGSNDGITWDDVAEGTNPSNSTSARYMLSFANELFYTYYRLYVLEGYSTTSVGVRSVNFYRKLNSFGLKPSDNYIKYNKITPTMTSDTAPAGYTITYSTRYSSSYSGYRAFDGNTASGYEWYSAQNDVVGAWIACQLPSAVTVKKLSIYNRDNSTAYAIKQLKLQGSNDGSTWTDIGTYNIASNTQALRSIFDVDNDTAYNRYRVYVVEGWASNYVSISELELYSEEIIPGCYASEDDIEELFEDTPILPQANRDVGIRQLANYDILIKDYISSHGGGGGASSLSDLDDIVATNPSTGDILQYNSFDSKWHSRRGKRFDLVYDSGGVNTYAQTGITGTPFDSDYNWPNIKEVNEYDELAIMIGFTDNTYTSENYLEVRFNVRLYETYSSNWKASAFKGIDLTFNDDPVNDPRVINFGLSMMNLPDDPYYQYRFVYTHNYSNDRIPGIRKIYGIRY